MILLLGGMGQGKLDYALEKTGYTMSQVAYTPQDAYTAPIFAGVEGFPDLDVTTLLEANPEVILICCEVGCGVVPMEPEERQWREGVGRLCCTLAQRANRVERIFCGLPMVIKGEENHPWN